MGALQNTAFVQATRIGKERAGALSAQQGGHKNSLSDTLLALTFPKVSGSEKRN